MSILCCCSPQPRGTSAMVGTVASETHEATRLPVGWSHAQPGKYRFIVHEMYAGKQRLSCSVQNSLNALARMVLLFIAWYKSTALCFINLYFIVW